MAFAAAVLPAISLAATVIGTGVAAYGAMQQGEAQANANRYQAQVAANNAIIARQNANAEIDAGMAKAADQDAKTRAAIGDVLASQGASGFDTNTGSAVDVRSGVAQVGRLDTLRTVDNAQKRSRDYLAQAGNYDASAGLYRMAGNNAEDAGFLNSLTSLMGGAANFSDKWLAYKNYGASASSPLVLSDYARF